MEHDYWRRRHGSNYADQQSFRTEHANPSYRAQESWLLAYLARLSEEQGGRKIRLLDFGCGFGRIARLIADLDHVDYFGYDFSEFMVEELKKAPPAAIAEDMDRRVRVAERFEQAFGADEAFDVILTISVLIHNPSDWVRNTIVSMFEHLAPSGRLVLIENPHTAISAVENFWHGGCWCHSFPRFIDGKADMEIVDRFVGRHAIYVITPHQAPRESKYFYRDALDQEAVALDFSGVLARGLDRAATNAETLTAELFAHDRDQIDLVGRLHDVTEERDIAGEKLILLKKRQAEDEARIAQLISEKSFLEQQLEDSRTATRLARARFADRQTALEDIGRGLTLAKTFHPVAAPPKEGNDHAQRPLASVLWNDRSDTRYANAFPEMRRVLHVFHQEWAGIRAAVGSLDGTKLALTADRPLTSEDLRAICKTISDGNFLRIVFHGLSTNTVNLISALHSRGLSEQMYLVKHGSPEQWVYAPERDMAFAALELLRAGFVKKLHVMKAGFDFPAKGLFKPVLFNMAPNLDGLPVAPADALQLKGVAFSAGWSHWRKNVHTNLLGAALSSAVSAVWHHADDVRLPSPMGDKLVHKRFHARENTFELMALASISLNVSITDCHPMVNIESQALGRPCLRGALHLDALETHPYVDLTMVADPSSVSMITAKIDKLLAIPDDERRELTLDYQRQSDRVARDRYKEFLEI